MTSPLYHWHGYNNLAFQLINNGGDTRLDVFMQIASILANPLFFSLYGATLAAAGLYFGFKHAQKSQWTGVAIWAIGVAAAGLTFLGGLFFLAYVNELVSVPSPVQVLGAGAVRLVGDGPGTPHRFLSGHVFFTTALVASLWLSLATHQRIAGALVVTWVGTSRVYIGAQFPSEVVATVLAAMVIAWAMRAAAVFAVPRVVAWWAGKLARRSRLR